MDLALAEAQRLLAGPTLLGYLTDPDTSEVVPITLVTDDGGPFRSFRFGAYMGLERRICDVVYRAMIRDLNDGHSTAPLADTIAA